MLRLLAETVRDSIRWPSVNRLLAVIGVAVGAANIVALVSVTDSARRQTLSMLGDYGVNTLFVSPYFETGRLGFQRSNALAFVPQHYLELVRDMPELEAVAGALMMPGHVGRGQQRVFATIEGADPDYPAIRGHATRAGRYFTAEEERTRARVCCLGAALIEPLFADAEPLGQEVVIKGERFIVIGTMIEKGVLGFESFDARIFVPLSTAQELYQIQGVHAIMARVRSGLALDDVQRQLETHLRAAEGLSEEDPADFSVTSVEQLTGILDSALGIFRLLLTGVASVALLVAGTGIMSVMLMQVLARTREIGVRRAVGARRRDIWLQFLAEAVAQTILGAVAGCILGVLASAAFCAIVGWRPYVTTATLLLAGAFSVGTGLVFGVYPAIHAARLKPIDCLRYE